MTHLDYLHLKLAELHGETAARIARLTPPLAACVRTSAAVKKAILDRDANALFLPLFERGVLVKANADRAIAEGRTIVIEAQEIDSFYINFAALLPPDPAIEAQENSTYIDSEAMLPIDAAVRVSEVSALEDEDGEITLRSEEAAEFFARSGIAPYLDPIGTLRNALLIRLPSIKARAMVNALKLDGVAITNGEACTAGLGVPSTIVQSYGFSEEESREAISLSWHPASDRGTIFAAFDKLLFRYNQIKQLS
ncbi:hypothetical protein AGMMS49521_1690 [Campylobacterota bacterium]|nr:hypothetical protein AGMMS49521_1690 [Campylobacterota bacterium]